MLKYKHFGTSDTKVSLRRVLESETINIRVESRTSSTANTNTGTTPRATESGYEQTPTELLARTLARAFCATHLYKDTGNTELWRRGGT
jgi:hypothetical protein